MKNLVIILGLAFLFTFSVTAQTPVELYNKAVYEEEINGDLNKAIELYGNLLQKYPGERSVVAKALYRLGLSNEKLGNKKARQYYENLVNNFGDQEQEVILARKRLQMLSSKNEGESVGVTLSKVYTSPMNIENYPIGELSNDGRYFAFTNWGGDWNLHVKDIKTGEKKVVSTEGSVGKGVAMGPIFSPDGTQIAYQFGPSLRIWNKLSGATQTKSNISYPLEWSRNGKKILSMFLRSKRCKLYITDVATWHKDSIEMNLKEWDPCPATISPDGEHVLFHEVSNEGNTDIYLYSLKNNSRKVISNHSADERIIAWEPDGAALLYLSNRPGGPAIYRVSIKNGVAEGRHELIYDGIDKTFLPFCIADNGALYFSSGFDFGSLHNISLEIDSKSIGKQQVHIDQVNDWINPCISNDGEKIAYLKRGGEEGDYLVITDHNGNFQGEYCIGYLAETIVPHRWSNDNSKVYVLDQVGGGNNVNIVHIKTGKIHRVKNSNWPCIELPDNKIISSSFIAEYITLIDTITNSRERIYAGPKETVCRNMKLSLDNNYLIFEEKKNYSNGIKRMNIGSWEVETLLFDDNFHFTIINWLEGGDKVLVARQNNNKSKSLKATLCVLDCKTKELTDIGEFNIETNEYGYYSQITAAFNPSKLYYKLGQIGSYLWKLTY